MAWSARLPLLLAALCAATPALAQSAPAREEGTGDSTIVVTGSTELDRHEVYEQARELSRMDGRTSRLYNEALARFAAPVCPEVTGLKSGLAKVIIDRVRANASRLKIRLAKGNCQPNLTVAFVEDGRSFLTELERKHPRVFNLLAESERAELVSDPGPVRVWNDVEPRWANGAPIARWGGKLKVPSPRGSANRLMLPTRTDIDQALILFDREEVLGMSLIQLADYATMRGLTHTRPATGDEPMDTILALFEGDRQNPEQLTSFDIGYLSSLYWWRPNVPAVDKLLGIRKRAEQAREQAD